LYGQQKIRLAAYDPQRVGKRKQEKFSPRYNKKLLDILQLIYS
jgi:hypothetical protein